MANVDLIDLFVQPLNEAGLPYMISGSLASMHYGEPRLTLDVDLVLHLEESDANRFLKLFSDDAFYKPPVEVLLIELRRPSRGHFNLIHFESGFKADCYPSKNHPYWDWAWSNRRLSAVGEYQACFAPPEYVVLWKLDFYREGGGDKHLRDIRGILAISGADMDLNLLEEAVSKLGLTDAWQKVRNT